MRRLGRRLSTFSSWARARWLRHVGRASWVVHLFIPAVVGGVVRGIMAGLGVSPETPVGEGIVDGMLIVGAYVVWQLIQSWAIGRPLLEEVEQIAALTVGPEREPALKFARDEMERLRRTLEGLLSEAGAQLHSAERALWEERFFASAGGVPYHGIDSNVPSEYMKRYKEFLRYHAEYLRHSSGGTRILLATPDSINHDRAHNRWW